MTGIQRPVPHRVPVPDSTAWGPVLIGMRGSGKSTVAPLLAARLELAWVDSDRELEERHGAPVAELLAMGEKRFRAREATLLAELLQRPGTVVATGGGAVLHGPVRTRCRARFTAWLDAPPSVLLQRISGGGRPPLTRLSPLEEVEHLLAEREPWYREASTLRVDVSHEPPQAVAERIAAAWERVQLQGS